MFINTYKNWLNDVQVGGFALMGQFMEMEEALMEKNEELIDKLELLGFDESGNRL
jgi:hypothetical protein